VPLRERLCVLLLRATTAIETWAWRRYRTPEMPLPLEDNSPTRLLTRLRIRHRAFHSVRHLPTGQWRVRLHLPDGTVHAATAESVDTAIAVLVQKVR
jgi:hypothetical protein